MSIKLFLLKHYEIGNMSRDIKIRRGKKYEKQQVVVKIMKTTYHKKYENHLSNVNINIVWAECKQPL